MDSYPVSRTKTKTLFMIVGVLFLSITDAQTTNSSLFKFADYVPRIASTATKVFTTKINLIPISFNQAIFDQTAFQNATTEFYSRAFLGFMSATVRRTTANTDAANQTVSFEVDYEVSYNYTIFSGKGSSDSIVFDRIGTLDQVKIGLESASAAFQGLYNVSTNSTLFGFSGSRICPLATCGSSYVVCMETSLGLSPVCQSVCFINFVCENGGTCVHRTATLSPNCNCVASSSVWYLGERCEYKVEVWMIAVFLVGFFALIFLIILIGCVCCRRKSKPQNREYKPEPPAKKHVGTAGQTSTFSAKHTDKKALEPRGYVSEPDTLPLSPASPMTSNAMVTVQESSSESSGPSVAEEYHQTAPVEDSIRPSTAAVVQTHSTNVQTPSLQSSENSEGQAESGILPRSSVDESENQGRRYNSLHFPDTRYGDSGVDRRYNTLDTASSRNRGTQTNTRINIMLPESILMNKI